MEGILGYQSGTHDNQTNEQSYRNKVHFLKLLLHDDWSQNDTDEDTPEGFVHDHYPNPTAIFTETEDVFHQRSPCFSQNNCDNETDARGPDQDHCGDEEDALAAEEIVADFKHALWLTWDQVFAH